MSLNKKSYFQGAGGENEPAPKRKKYKSDPAITVQPRFVEPFFKNYDPYEIAGQHGPGAGWHSMNKYKSTKEFINAKRKKNKNKYKSKDSIKARAQLFAGIIKKAIDFAIDEIIESGPISEQDDSYSSSVGIGGYLDEYLPQNDLENKPPTALNFGRDYQDYSTDDLSELLKFFGHITSPNETELLGMPNGYEPEEELDSDRIYHRLNMEYDPVNSHHY